MRRKLTSRNAQKRMGENNDNDKGGIKSKRRGTRAPHHKERRRKREGQECKRGKTTDGRIKNKWRRRKETERGRTRRQEYNTQRKKKGRTENEKTERNECVREDKREGGREAERHSK